MITVFLFVIGLAFGSFVNALVWRIHELETTKSKKKRRALSPVSGRSMCPECKHELSAKDLIPVFSWVYLKARCRYCHKSISWQYPLVELLGGALFALSYVFWPYMLAGNLQWLSFIVWLSVITVLLALFVYDLKWMELPDSLVAWLTGLAVSFVLIERLALVTTNSEVVSAGLGGLLLFGLFYGLFQISGGKWIGGGDVKIAVALGLLAGSPLKTLLLLFIASLAGSLIGIPLLLKSHDRKLIKLPFGPLLFLGLIIVFFFGTGIIQWYETNLLYL